MNKLSIILLGSLAAFSLLLGVILIDQSNKESQLSFDPHTVIAWDTCWFGVVQMPDCRKDTPEDQESCNKAAEAVYKCQDILADETRVSSCTKYWFDYLDAEKYPDVPLPQSFYQCANDCREYAKQNTFYYENIYTVYWDYCAAYY